jgi:hypothetical protein
MRVVGSSSAPGRCSCPSSFSRPRR